MPRSVLDLKDVVIAEVQGMSPECSEMRLAKVLSKPLGLLYAEDQLHPQAESTDLHLGRM